MIPSVIYTIWSLWSFLRTLSNRQANDSKRVLRGKQPTYLIAFCLSFVVLSCFVGNCPSKIQENEEKKIWSQNACKLARPVPAVARPCLTMPCKPQNSSKLARPVPVVARSCTTPNPHIPQKFSSSSFILHHTHLSSLKPLSKTSITKNLQTFISPSNLHQIKKNS